MQDLTTVELQRVAKAVLRGYLDIEAGQPAGSVLRRLLAAGAPAPLPAPPSAVGQPGVRHSDLGPVSVLRLGGGRAYACAAAREPGTDAWTALSTELDSAGDRLRVLRLGRVGDAAAIQRSGEAQRPVIGDGQLPPAPPPHLAQLLGEIPTVEEARDSWLIAAAVIDTYRERHGIDDERSALGPRPADAEQSAERQRAVACTRQLVTDIDRLEPDRSRGQDTRDEPAGPDPAGPDLGR